MSPLQRPIGFSPQEISSMVNELVVYQHAENAAFLWTQRDRAVRAPHYRLKDIARLDERVEANIDGLRVAGETGWKFCEQALELQGAGEVFAAAVLAFEGGSSEKVQKVLEIAQAAPELGRAVVSALGWITKERVASILASLISAEVRFRRRLGIGGYAVHRIDPETALKELAVDADAAVRARAIIAVGELGRIDLLPLVKRYVQDADSDFQMAALWCCARLGERTPEIFRTLESFVVAGGKNSEVAMDIALRCLTLEEAKRWRRQFRDNPAFLRLSTRGIGIVGDPALMSELLVLMEKKETSRVAGESFSMITGVDLAYHDLERDEPTEPKSEAQNIRTDEELEMEVQEDPDADLPWPHPELVRKWWDSHREEFQSGVRYLCGKEMTRGNLQDVLKVGYQRQRIAAALELALREPRHPLFEVRTPGKRQQQSLGLWSW